MRNREFIDCLQLSVGFLCDYLDVVVFEQLRNRHPSVLAIDDHLNNCQVGIITVTAVEGIDENLNNKASRKRPIGSVPVGVSSKTQRPCSCGGIADPVQGLLQG